MILKTEVKTSDTLVTKRIEVCKSCNGSGIHKKEELVDYHKSEYETWNELCSMCGGEGGF